MQYCSEHNVPSQNAVVSTGGTIFYPTSSIGKPFTCDKAVPSPRCNKIYDSSSSWYATYIQGVENATLSVLSSVVAQGSSMPPVNLVDLPWEMVDMNGDVKYAITSAEGPCTSFNTRLLPNVIMMPTIGQILNLSGVSLESVSGTGLAPLSIRSTGVMITAKYEFYNVGLASPPYHGSFSGTTFGSLSDMYYQHDCLTMKNWKVKISFSADTTQFLLSPVVTKWDADGRGGVDVIYTGIVIALSPSGLLYQECSC